MNARRFFRFFVVAGLFATVVSCSPRLGSEGEHLKWRMFQWSKWVGDHRAQLELLAREAGPYATLESLDWPRVNRSQLFFPGRAGPRERKPATVCAERRLYLDREICIVLLDRRQPELAARYASWAARGRDERGEFCAMLGGGWFLCSDRGGSRFATLEAGNTVAAAQ